MSYRASRNIPAFAAAVLVAAAAPVPAWGELAALYTSEDSGFFTFALHGGKMFGGTYGGGASRVYRFDASEFVMEHVFPDAESVFRLIGRADGGGVLLANCERNSTGAAPLFKRNDATNTWEDTGVGVVPEDARSMGLGGGFAGGRYWVGVIPYIPGETARTDIWSSLDGLSFSRVQRLTDGAAKPFAEYWGSVYTGTLWTGSPAIHRFNGSSFERAADLPGWGDSADYALEYKGALYISGSGIARFKGGAQVEVVLDPPSGDGFFQQLAKVRDPASGAEWLYACWSKGWRAGGGGAQLWRTSDGTGWSVYQTFPESECWAAATLTGGDLWVGTREDRGRGRVYHEEIFETGDAGFDAGSDAGNDDAGAHDAGGDAAVPEDAHVGADHGPAKPDASISPDSDAKTSDSGGVASDDSGNSGGRPAGGGEDSAGCSCAVIVL
ncbi:MAG: hypothetical protein HY897_06190 [Deltaproteobacteria bacterium]|nr:hypothetical protein [Deltaproteobacteria bacterium]